MTLLKGCTQSERVSIAIMKCGVVGGGFRESWGASSSYYLFPSSLHQNLAIRGEVSIKHVYVKSDFALLAGGHRHLAQSSESLELRLDRHYSEVVTTLISQWSFQVCQQSGLSIPVVLPLGILNTLMSSRRLAVARECDSGLQL
jgi:hypothetical protein